MADCQSYQDGMAAYRSERYEEAIEHLTAAAGGSTGEALLSRFYLSQAHYHVAISRHQEARYREAIGHFQTAARLNSSGGGFPRYLADCYAGSRRFPLAVREYDSLLCRRPHDVELRIRLALAHWKDGNQVEALAVIREGLRHAPENAELHYQLGVLLASDDEIEEAHAAFERALELDPRHVRAMERLAQCCAAGHRYERALSFLQQAHQLEPDNARIAWQLSLLGGSLAEQGEQVEIAWQRPRISADWDEESIRQLGELITETPEFVETFLDLPECRMDPEVFSTLAAILEQCLAVHPEFADLHYHCGQVYRRLGRTESAISHAEQAVRINPRYVRALILLAELYRRTDRPDEAVNRLEQAVEAGGDYPDVHHMLGQLHQNHGRTDRARAAYEKALGLNGEYPEALEALAALKD